MDLKHLSPLESSSYMAELAISSYILSWTPWFFYYIFPLVLLSVSAVIGKGIYNRYFHPLSRFPGPFWASMTDIYLVFFIKSVPTYGLEMHKKHGKYYGCSPNRGLLLELTGHTNKFRLQAQSFVWRPTCSLSAIQGYYPRFIIARPTSHPSTLRGYLERRQPCSRLYPMRSMLRRRR